MNEQREHNWAQKALAAPNANWSFGSFGLTGTPSLITLLLIAFNVDLIHTWLTWFTGIICPKNCTVYLWEWVKLETPVCHEQQVMNKPDGNLVFTLQTSTVHVSKSQSVNLKTGKLYFSQSLIVDAAHGVKQWPEKLERVGASIFQWAFSHTGFRTWWPSLRKSGFQPLFSL